MRHALALLAVLAPLPAAAHPHVFIDTGFEVILDETGALTHVRTTWAYDEFYTLLISEDLKIDQDFDGKLTEDEQQRLTGFDMQWIEGYTGDLDARLDGQPLVLSGPLEPTAVIENGRVVTTHLRAVENAPVLAGKLLSLKPYDPTFYTAYTVALPVTLKGGDACMIEAIEPDIDAAMEDMRQQLLRLDKDADLEENGFPEVGEEFATDVRISCPGS
ncbi:DUF1007 family protein [Seohaeicola zhoushanensis]|uniref:Polyphosphate kinase n=1 Tax=Seohaeicola zhoushanensis TaxID=1569283 RepID=A0A8J3GWG4_9RHOB|nr:DUF1007 family protein [Seohaeicola zhoushanensis]GHF48780.1 polyphosphate kinase [Seohaeicola zhoushanensis]